MMVRKKGMDLMKTYPAGRASGEGCSSPDENGQGAAGAVRG
jgi:hypothetical protein